MGLIIRHSCLKEVKNNQQFYDAEQQLLPQVKMVIFLMELVGISQLKKFQDYQELIYRTYLFYGNLLGGANPLMDHMILNGEFFRFYFWPLHIRSTKFNEKHEQELYDTCLHMKKEFVISVDLLQDLKRLKVSKRRNMTRNNFEANLDFLAETYFLKDCYTSKRMFIPAYDVDDFSCQFQGLTGTVPSEQKEMGNLFAKEVLKTLDV